MIVPNASITSWRQAGAVRGDGRPTLGAERITSGLPLPCRVVDPSFSLRQTLTAQGIKFDRAVELGPEALRVLAIDPRAGDRISLIADRDFAQAVVLVVQMVMPAAAPRVAGRPDAVRLACLASADGAEGFA